jgi:hypothetical protein
MLSDIDNILFPNSCEVISLASQHFVYPIMKNGSSSFYYQMQQGLKPEWKILRNQEVKCIEAPLIVFLRNPKKRFISGVNTYLQHLDRDGLKLDRNTVLWFIDNYLFLNRHYYPQFFWLVNLANHAGVDVRLDLKSMSDISVYTDLNFRADVTPPTMEFLKSIEHFNWSKLELYFYLDQLLVDMVGQCLTFQEILIALNQDATIKNLVLDPSLKINNVLSSFRS